MIRTLIILGLVLLLGSSCQPPLEQGYVTEKEFTPAHTDTIYVPQYTEVCTGGYANVPRSCYQQVSYYLPITTHYPGTWQLRIKNGDRWEWVTVTETEYMHIGVDDFWVRPTEEE